MTFLPHFGRCKASPKVEESLPAASAEPAESHLLRTLSLVSAALGAVALGLVIGRELRIRYKFNRRTPYDLYAHSGDRIPEIADISEVEFGVGI